MLDLFGCKALLRCRQTDRYVRYNESWIDYSFLPPWELVEDIRKASHNPACICNRDFTEVMLKYLRQFYELQKLELIIVRTITFEKEIFMEISNGGKALYLCSNCYSPHIKRFKKTEMLCLNTDDGPRYATLRPNHCLCADCGSIFRWSHRVKLPTKLIGDSVGDSIQAVTDVIKQLGYWAKKPERAQVEKIVDVVNNGGKELDIRILPPMVEQVLTVNENGDKVTADGTIWSPKGQDDFSHWTHGPNWFGVWAPYNGWRFKDHYNIELWNGEIFYGVYPNANSWHAGGIDINDKHVRRVQLCKSEECPRWASRDDDEKKAEYYLYRAKRNAEMFGTNDMADWLPVQNEELKDIDPFDKNLTEEQREAIIAECKANPWYFFSMIYRDKINSGEVEV